MKQLYSAKSGLEAHEVRLFLESHGITAHVLGDNSVLESVGASTPASVPNVFVEDADFERATQLLPQFSSAALVPQETAIAATAPTIVSQRTNSSIALEVAVVLTFVWLPAFIRGMFPIPLPGSLTFFQYTVAALVQQTSWSVVLLYLIHKSGDAWSRFGIVRPRLVRDPIAGALILFSTFVFVYATYILATSVFDESSLAQLFSRSSPIPRPTPGDTLILVVAMIVVGLNEELVFRSYLITQLNTLFDSRWKSVVFAALIFGSGHLYQGAGGSLNACLIGLSLGFFFCVTKRLWPVAVAHALYNMLALWPHG